MIVEILDAAEADLEEAYDFLERREEGLGRKLLAKFHKTLGLLQLLPRMFPRYYRNVRVCRIRRSQHGIFFRVTRRSVVILAFFDLRQDPKYLKRRLREI